MYFIKEMRTAKKLSQAELAKRSGVSRATISYLETHNDAKTSTGTLLKIAKALGCKVSDIFVA
jgi:transcriptional regulator with XRE-family HTH domain